MARNWRLLKQLEEATIEHNMINLIKQNNKYFTLWVYNKNTARKESVDNVRQQMNEPNRSDGYPHYTIRRSKLVKNWNKIDNK